MQILDLKVNVAIRRAQWTQPIILWLVNNKNIRTNISNGRRKSKSKILELKKRKAHHEWGAYNLVRIVKKIRNKCLLSRAKSKEFKTIRQ